MVVRKSLRKFSLPLFKRRNSSKSGIDVVVIDESATEMIKKGTPPTSTDVHNCRSLTCIACNQSGSVVFVKAVVPNNTNGLGKTSSADRSQASTAPSSPSPTVSQKTLTPPPTCPRKQVVFENISSVGVIRAVSTNPYMEINDEQPNTTPESNSKTERKKENDLKLNIPYKVTKPRHDTNDEKLDGVKLSEPYKLTRSRSLDSLDLFVASIESARLRNEEEDDVDVDELIFGTPWKRNE